MKKLASKMIAHNSCAHKEGEEVNGQSVSYDQSAQLIENPNF